MTDTTRQRRRPFRSRFEGLLDRLLLDGRVAAWSYRCGLQGRLGVTRHEVALGAGQELPRPLVVAFASDLHAGPTTHPELFDQLAEQIRRARPDLLLLGGDYVSLGARHVARLAPFLDAVAGAAPLGTYAVAGNHDIWHGRAPIEAALRAAGVRVLVNQNVRLPAPFGMVSVCGIDEPWTGAPSASATFADAGAVRIYLMHSPDGMWHLTGETFALGLAGHTHGGQVATPGGRPVVRPNGPLSRQYCHGRFDFPAHGPLIVSRGVGCSMLPLRINANPELVLCTLG
jgi:predicted MPP superfamily phosphohydrolase